jgi:hypothetical protein
MQHHEPCLLPRPLQWQSRPEILLGDEPSRFEFITTEQLVADTRRLVGRLPDDLSAIVGIPRSGMLPASLLATLLHVPLYAIDGAQGLLPIGHGRRLDHAGPGEGPLLVIDDSVNGGHAMYQARQAISHAAYRNPVLYAALYPRPSSVGCVDLFARLAPLPHLFEWNLFNCQQTQAFAFDMDGVLCDDFQGDEANSEEYLEFLETARPRWLPRRHEIPLIVTARLERYRRQTEAWLTRFGIRVRKLVMGPWNDHGERRVAFQAGPYKGGPFVASGCRLFVESDERQAKAICEYSRRPVLCASTGRIFQ